MERQVKHEYLINLLSDWRNYLTQGTKDYLPKPKDRILTKDDVCFIVCISPATFYRWCSSGEIKYMKAAGYRIWVSDLADFLVKKESHIAI
jgi:hypothetical protein